MLTCTNGTFSRTVSRQQARDATNWTQNFQFDPIKLLVPLFARQMTILHCSRERATSSIKIQNQFDYWCLSTFFSLSNINLKLDLKIRILVKWYGSQYQSKSAAFQTRIPMLSEFFKNFFWKNGWQWNSSRSNILL